MSFPCLICGELPIVDPPSVPTSLGSGSINGGARMSNVTPVTTASVKQTQVPLKASGGGGGGGSGTTIRTLSKDVSDKIFQNLCRHLYIKSEPNWFIQNPGENMPLCAACSATVLEIYTLQTKVDHFTSLIKKHVWKLERIVADTEIACNWMATREEQEKEEARWNGLPCPHTTIRIARERHEKFRNQILQNFKNKVKQRLKLRAAGQQDYDILDAEPPLLQMPPLEPINFENGDRAQVTPTIQSQSNPPFKKLRLDVQRSQLTPSPCSSSQVITVSGGGMNIFKNLNSPNVDCRTKPLHQSGNNYNRSRVDQEFQDESEMSDDHDQVYPDVQIVCTSGAVDYDVYKEETEASNDGEESMEQEGSYWYAGEENADEDEQPMVIPDGEEVVWLAHNVALRKSFLEQLLIENLKPSVFLRKLMFAVFGIKQIANSSGTTGSTKPGAKPSLDRNKFEALREYTIDTYGIRDNSQELDDLNRKIRTICCDARKALKRKAQKPQAQQSLDGFTSARRTPSGSIHADEITAEMSAGNVTSDDMLQMSVNHGNEPVQENRGME